MFVQKSRQVGYSTAVNLFIFNSIQHDKKILHISPTSFGAKNVIDNIKRLIGKYKPSILTNKSNTFKVNEIITKKSKLKSIFNRMVLREHSERYDYIFIDEFSNRYNTDLRGLLSHCIPLLDVNGTIIISSDNQLYLGEENTTQFIFTNPLDLLDRTKIVV